MFRNRMSNKYVPRPVANAKRRRRYAEDGLEVQDNFIGPIQPSLDTDEFFEEPVVGPPTEEMMLAAQEEGIPMNYQPQTQPQVAPQPQIPINQEVEVPTSYVIQKGDTLGKIAKMTGMSVQEIAKMNNIKDVNKIYAGATLKLDPSVRIPKGTSNTAVAKTGGKKATPINIAKKENKQVNQQVNNTFNGYPVVARDPFPIPLKSTSNINTGLSIESLIGYPKDYNAQYSPRYNHVTYRNNGKVNYLNLSKQESEDLYKKKITPNELVIKKLNNVKANGGLIGNIGDEVELTPEQIRYYKSLGYEFE